jgi:hypothetical protein
VKLKRKINLTKGSKNKKYQKNDYQIEKKKAYHKLGLKNEIEKKINILQRAKNINKKSKEYEPKWKSL